jgi:hypothetical protein
LKSKHITFEDSYFMSKQWDFIQCDDSFQMYVGGKGSGKTFAFLHKTLIQLVKRYSMGIKGGGAIQIGYPTYDMAKRTFVPEFSDLLDNCNIDYEYLKADRVFNTQCGTVKIMSLDNPSRIIADNLTDVGIDELDSLDYEYARQSYLNFVSRLRKVKDPVLYITTSPEGFRYTHELAESGNFTVFRASARDNDRLPNREGFIQQQIEAYGNNPLLIAQYIDGEFVNTRAGRAYYAYDRILNTVPDKEIAILKEGTIYIGMDFNVNPMTAVISCYRGGVLYVYDEIWLKDSNTFQMCDEIKRRYGSTPCSIFPDSTGGARKTSATQTDLSILRSYGYNVISRNTNPLQIDRVNVVNRALKDGKGLTKLYVSSNCKHLIEDLEQVTWREKGDRRLDDSNRNRTHISDALGYLCVGVFGLVQTMPSQVGLAGSFLTKGI